MGLAIYTSSFFPRKLPKCHGRPVATGGPEHIYNLYALYLQRGGGEGGRKNHSHAQTTVV